MSFHQTAALALLLLVGGIAQADQVRLTNGNVVEGKARRVGDVVVVEMRAGELRLRADEVTEIVRGKTRHELYDERRAATTDDDADAQVALGDWCKEQGLRTEARRHWQRALDADAEHRAAHGRLGHIRYEDRWLTAAEYRRARGFELIDGKWVHRDELRREEYRERVAEARKKHQKTIEDAVALMTSRKRATRLKGKLALQKYAEERGDLGLALFASRVAEHYNAQWGRIRAAQRATALTEVRATHAQLQRPIPTFSTSLGANSTPVTIQLPELKIASIRTTVKIPLGIELDEDP